MAGDGRRGVPRCRDPGVGRVLRRPGLEGNGLLFSLIGLSAAGAIVAGAIRNRPRRLLPWMLFAAAQVSFVAGDLLYYTFHSDFPSVGDVFYLAVYPLLVAGLLLLVRARSAGRDRASKKIVDDHGGTIHVESAPGRGTTVEFTIPLVSPAGAGAVPRSPPSLRPKEALAAEVGRERRARRTRTGP